MKEQKEAKTPKTNYYKKKSDEYRIKVDENKINNLKAALSVGTPLTVALSYSGISASTWFYWLSLASIVVYIKEMEEIRENAEITKAGVSLVEIQENAIDLQSSTTFKKSSAIGTFVEPTPESLLRYKSNELFRNYCNEVYDMVKEMDAIRSQIVVYHLNVIKNLAGVPKANVGGSQWFLERTLPDYFGRPQDKVVADENSTGEIPSIQVNFIDPNTKESNDRVEQMERLLDQQINGVNKMT